MSVPAMITEVIVRVSYFIKCRYEGHTITESIPFGSNETKPKLQTMLWIAQTVAAGINAGKVVLTKNPLAINYPQWLRFIKLTVEQFKWILIKKPELRIKYLQGFIDKEWERIVFESMPTPPAQS